MSTTTLGRRAEPGAPRVKPSWGWLSPSRIGGVYLLVLIAAVFSVLEPERFFTLTTVRTILNQSAVSILIALAVTLPLAAGLFDLSIGYILGLSGVVGAWLLTNTSLPSLAVIAVTLLVAVALGLLNAVVVVGLRVQSLIATLATGSIFFAMTMAVSGDKQIVVPMSGDFANLLALNSFAGIMVPVYFCAAIMLILGLAMERTAIGRYWYAIGFDREVARLTGIRVGLLEAGALVIGAAIAGLAGLVLAGQLGAGSPNVGANYLLPAFAGAFLGATQIRAGRFNPWGTVLAVLILMTGNHGLLVSGGPLWTPQVFQGVALILAVGVTQLRGRKRASSLESPAKGQE